MDLKSFEDPVDDAQKDETPKPCVCSTRRNLFGVIALLLVSAVAFLLIVSLVPDNTGTRAMQILVRGKVWDPAHDHELERFEAVVHVESERNRITRYKALLRSLLPANTQKEAQVEWVELVMRHFNGSVTRVHGHQSDTMPFKVVDCTAYNPVVIAISEHVNLTGLQTHVVDVWLPAWLGLGQQSQKSNQAIGMLVIRIDSWQNETLTVEPSTARRSFWSTHREGSQTPKIANGEWTTWLQQFAHICAPMSGAATGDWAPAAQATRSSPMKAMGYQMSQNTDENTGKSTGKNTVKKTVANVVKACQRQGQVGNGVCDDACNNNDNEWDGGDCCGWQRAQTHWDSPRCSSGPVVLLLHGASWRTISTGDMSRQFSDVNMAVENEVETQRLWGTLPQLLKHFARQVIVNSHNTFDLDWSNPILQRAYYHKALSVHQNGGIVFAHSMANLILGGACLDQDLCDARFYAVGAPLWGARTIEQTYPMHGLALVLNNTGVQSMRPHYRQLGQGTLATLVDKHKMFKGALCGISAFGTGGWVGVELAQLQRLAQRDWPWRTLTDGIVTMDECVLAQRVKVPNNNDMDGGLETDNVDWARSRMLGPFQVQTQVSEWSLVYANHQDIAGVSFNRTAQRQQLDNPALLWYTRMIALVQL